MSVFIVYSLKNKVVCELERFGTFLSDYNKAVKFAKEYKKEYGKRTLVVYNPVAKLED